MIHKARAFSLTHRAVCRRVGAVVVVERRRQAPTNEPFGRFGIVGRRRQLDGASSFRNALVVVFFVVVGVEMAKCRQFRKLQFLAADHTKLGSS